ncbi:hypothetical protein Emed_007349 [Eimeria media]
MQPSGVEQQILGLAEGRMPPTHQQPSQQRDQHNETQLAMDSQPLQLLAQRLRLSGFGLTSQVDSLTVLNSRVLSQALHAQAHPGPSALKQPPQFEGKAPREWLEQMERYHDRIRLDPSVRVDDAFQYLQGPALSHFCFASQNGTAPATWENFREFILERFSYQGIGETIRRLRDLRWKGSLERLAAEFSAVLSQGVSPPQSELVDLFLGRVPLHLVTELGTADFATWTEAKEALRRIRSPKEHLTARWLVNASPDLLRAAAATPHLLPSGWRRRQGSMSAHQSKDWARDDSSTDNCALSDDSREIVTSQQERSHSHTIGRTKFRRCTVAVTKQRCAAAVFPCDKAHSQAGKHELAANPQAAPPGRVPSESAVKSELEQPHESAAQLEVDAAACSSAQIPSDQGMHLNITQQPVSKSTDSLPLWWRNVHQSKPLVFLSQASQEARLAGLQVSLWGKEVLALLDTGATHSFVSPRLVDELQLQTKTPPEPMYLTVASGQQLEVPALIPKVSFKVGNFGTSGRFLVAPVPYPIILGLDWLCSLSAVVDLGHGRVTVFRGSGCFNLSVVKVTADDLQERLGQTESDTVREEGKAAHADLLDSVNQLGPQASALVRKQPKRYKNFKSKAKRVPIDELVAAARTAGADLPTEQPDCSLLAAAPLHVQQPVTDAADEGIRTSESSQSLPGSTRASHKQHKVAEWLASAPQQGVHPQVVQLVDKYRDLFLDELPDGLPPPRAFDMTIVTVPNATVPKGAIRAILQEYLRKKWIQSSRSPYAAPVMLVPKKGDPPGSPGSRLVINYRPLNAVTIAPEVPLPVVEDVLASLQGAKWFTTLDMEQGFHQVRVSPEDRHKTAFRTLMGQFEWRVMPFGLKGAPSTFQASMNSIFLDMLGQGVLIYMDDVLVYAATLDEHLRLLDRVLARLLQHKMYSKLTKCKFAAQSIEYLGYRVGADGIHPSTEKVSAIALWPTELANETQVRQLLGTVNYCRNFMGPEFAVLARPLQQLLKQKAAFQWTAAHSSAVQALKDRLIHYTKLSLPDLTKPFILRTDASGVAIVAVLEQDNKPLGFLTKRLSDAEMRYSTYDQELLAIVRALERWRHLLITAEDSQQSSCNVLSVSPTLREFGEAYKRAKETAPEPVLIPDIGRFKLVNRVLCIHLQGLWRICVPNFPGFRQRILYQHHDLPTAGHLGITKTYNQVAMKFFWKGIREYVRTYVETCPRCRASKAICQKPAGLLQPLSVPSRRWSSVSLDFIGGLPLSGDGYDTILTVVDSLSDLAWLSTRYMPARGCPKFQQRYIGPYRILERIGPAAYKLQLPPSMSIHPVFHVSLLSPHRPRPKDMASPPDWEPVGAASDGLPIYEVESILDQRGEGDTARYLVKWKGFPDSDATWEPLANLDNCPALLRAFRASRNAELRRQAQRTPPRQKKPPPQPS